MSAADIDGPFAGPLPIDEIFPESSFTALLHRRGMSPEFPAELAEGALDVPEATTVLALRWGDGVVMAGDRRATAGTFIAHKRIQKVYPADDFSAVAISGTAGMAIELIKLFQTELEHYEKIEGTRLSLEGKANYLARMVRGNLAMAIQGLVVVPLFSGYDEEGETGKLFTFDVVGGRYEEQDYAAAGSGGMEARSFLKAMYRPDVTADDALALAVEALVAAAEEDAATGGPDLKRGIYPNVVTVTADGYAEVGEDQIGAIAERVLESRP